ncbi:MAG: TetR family transcriptional regulator C-terminal domain-containing protein [Spongiibacteraceae bacterium]|nr:TetR family transcriptional regulator C-terminal domain-containing protein [Spongiibacteraceae bacterium]
MSLFSGNQQTMTAQKVSKKAAIREENMQHIISVAEKVFATKGYGGATTQEIADYAGLPKANIHYYFPSKEDLYLAVLKNILDIWILDADILEQYDDPKTALGAYIELKMNHSFSHPYASKVWASEIIQGAPVLGSQLKTYLAKWSKRKIRKIQSWINSGAIVAVKPENLLYMIWASTQHYADFNHQIKVPNSGRVMNAKQRQIAIDDVKSIILRGIGIDV